MGRRTIGWLQEDAVGAAVAATTAAAAETVVGRHVDGGVETEGGRSAAEAAEGWVERMPRRRDLETAAHRTMAAASSERATISSTTSSGSVRRVADDARRVRLGLDGAAAEAISCPRAVSGRGGLQRRACRALANLRCYFTVS